MKKKVLIISYYFPPTGGAGTLRVLKFLKFLPIFNWEPFVLTVKNPYTYMKDESLEKEIKNFNNIHYSSAILIGNFFRRIFHYKPQVSRNYVEKGGLLKSFWVFIKNIFLFLKNLFYTVFFCPDEYVGWIPFAVIKGKKIIKSKGINVIMTSGPPSSVHIIGLFLKKITGKKWITDFRDLWNQYYLNYNPYNVGIKSKLDKFLEHIVLSNSDKIIVVSDVMKMQLQERFPDVKSEKFSVITNGFDPEDFKDVEPFRYEKKFTILHYGTLFKWRKPDNFLRALKNLISKNKDFGEDVSIVFMGIFHNDTLECVKKFDLGPYIKIIDYKPYYESLQYLKGADILLLITGELSFNRNMLTMKVFDYIGANKPILTITENGALKKLIEEYSLGKGG